MTEIAENINKSSLHTCSAIILSDMKSNVRKTKPKNSKKIQSSVSELLSGSTNTSGKGSESLFSDMKETDTDTETELAALSIPTPNTLKYLFRSHIPIEYLYDVLEKICVKNEKYYIIDFNSYRLLQFHDLYTDFSERIIQAYKPSKQKYVTRTLTYNSFVTIVRHICRINGIPFDTKFNYQYSLYNIDYYIYFTYHPTPSIFPPLLHR